MAVSSCPLLFDDAVCRDAIACRDFRYFLQLLHILPSSNNTEHALCRIVDFPIMFVSTYAARDLSKLCTQMLTLRFSLIYAILTFVHEESIFRFL